MSFGPRSTSRDPQRPVLAERWPFRDDFVLILLGNSCISDTIHVILSEATDLLSLLRDKQILRRCAPQDDTASFICTAPATPSSSPLYAGSGRARRPSSGGLRERELREQESSAESAFLLDRQRRR